MIVSHEHRFVFLKTRKTAGSSVEVLLEQIAGEDAVVTPQEDLPVPGARNWCRRFNPMPELLRHPMSARPTMREWRDREAFSSHLPAWRARERLGRRVWNSYFVFCFERTPWEKATSMYFYRARDMATPPPFADWLASHAHHLSDWYIYADRGRIIVDAVGRYEHLTEDLDQMLQRVGLTGVDMTLPRLHGDTRKDRAVTFTPSCVDIVHRVFEREFEHFGFDPTPPRAATDLA